MGDEPKKRSWPRISLVAAVLLAYVASIGPTYRTRGEAALSHPAYAPLMAASRCPPIGHALVWYLNQWSNSEGFAIYGKLDGDGAVLFFKVSFRCGFAQSDDSAASD
jgi:hypothetical protein